MGNTTSILIVIADVSSCGSLDLFDLVYEVFLPGMPDCGTVLQLGPYICFVGSFFGLFVWGFNISFNESKCICGLGCYTINVIGPGEVLTDGDA